VTIATERVLGSAQIVLALDGAPGTEIRMTAQDLAAADPAGLVIRLENRLSGLEALRTKTLDEIERLRTEASRARDDMGKPFSQASQLAAARDRVRGIGEQLLEAARSPRQDEHYGMTGTATSGGAAPTRMPVGTRSTLAVGVNGSKMSAMPGTVGGARPGQTIAERSVPAGQESTDTADRRQHVPVSTAQRSFPENNPVADPTVCESAVTQAPAPPQATRARRRPA